MPEHNREYPDQSQNPARRPFSAFNVSPVNNPENFRHAVARVAHMAHHASDSLVDQGLAWYPNVHDAASSGAHDLGGPVRLEQAAGIVASVSPNMDFERNNIHALHEIGSLTPEHWDMIAASANQERVRNPDTGRTSAAPRHPEVRDMLREVAPSISAATDRDLMKARGFLLGGSIDEILSRRTAPKTNSFAWNIVDPDMRHHDVATIDGRQSDIIANEMRPWTWSGRGISSAALLTGNRTRYEDHEDVMRASVPVLNAIDPRFRGANAASVQAVTWEAGKLVERDPDRFPTVSGKPRTKGVSRVGQPYVL